MNLNKISIRTRFFLLLTGSVLFWLFTGFLVLSLVDSLSGYQSTSHEIHSIPDKIQSLENSIHSFYLNDLQSDPFHESGRSEGMESYSSTHMEAYTLFRDLKEESILSRDELIRQKFDHILEYLGIAGDYAETINSRSRQRGWNTYGLEGTLRSQIIDFNSSGLPQVEPQIQEFFSEIQIYLLNPDGKGMNTLRNKVIILESGMLEVTTFEPESGTQSLSVLLENLVSLLDLDLELGTTRYEGFQNRIFQTLNIIYEEAGALTELFDIKHAAKSRQVRWSIIILIVISASFFGILLFFFSRSVDRHLRILKESTIELAAGRFPEYSQGNEINELSEIAGLLDNFSLSLEHKARFAADLSEGNDPAPLESLSQNDSLANSLINLGKSIKAAMKEEERHQISREERRWANEGIAKFGEILRIYNNDISSLSENIIMELVNYLNASAGGFFLVNNSGDEEFLELIASFAFDRKKYLNKRYSPGEGLIGTCAIEKEKIFLTEIPEEYLNITSGLGESKPRCLLVMPLQLEEHTLGVIEIASIRVFADHEIQFVESIAESIASAVSTVQMNMRTAELLEQSQEQAREMAKQEEIMRQNMEELQTTQDESARRESEISGILTGIHNSSHVAEFNMEEELISINDKFLQLLESQRTQLLGKKYHEIVGISRHTDSYKAFWKEIRDGKTVSRVDKVKLIAGQDIWLRQTFTPIRDKDGNPFKVLNITDDISETVEQRESLEKQANEITRANIEMRSFSDAVDKALIKCVYSPAGQMLELNENFEQITGYTQKEMLGKNNRVFLQRVEKEQFEKIWEDVLKDKSYSGVIRRTKPTGEEVWLMSTFTPVKDEDGNIIKVFFLGQDITERKLKYQLLEEANREIERLRGQKE